MSYTLRDLPLNERPRERLKNFGIDSLSSVELIELILGRGVQGESVIVTAQKLLAHFGSVKCLSDASLEDLMAIKGIGIAKAAQLLACFNLARRADEKSVDSASLKVDLKDLPVLLQQKIGHYTKEHLVVVSLDSRRKMIKLEVIAVGILNANLAHPREIFETAIKRHAVSIVISHNHPSGDIYPSDADILFTERIMAAGKLFDIPVIDHLIVSSKKYYSFSDNR